jgi:hypothetical protein
VMGRQLLLHGARGSARESIERAGSGASTRG